MDEEKHQTPATGTGASWGRSHASGWQEQPLLRHRPALTSLLCSEVSPGQRHLLPRRVPCPHAEELLCRGKGYVMQLLLLLELLTTNTLLLPPALVPRAREGRAAPDPAVGRSPSSGSTKMPFTCPHVPQLDPAPQPWTGSPRPRHSLGRLEAPVKAAVWEHPRCAQARAGGRRL